MRDWIRIDRLELDCIVGTRPHERERQQRVRVDLALHADLSRAGRSGKISMTADYDRVAREVVELLRFRHYHLVEMAAEEVCAMLLGMHRALIATRIRIEKPGALEGRARAASVEVLRERGDFAIRDQAASHGRTVTLLETREALLQRLVVDADKKLNNCPGVTASAVQWLQSGSLDGATGSLEPELPSGATSFSSEAQRCWTNPGPHPAVVFRCWRLG